MGWQKVADVADVHVGGMVRCTIQDDDIALYHLQEGFFATSDVCTHASESLTLGKLNGDVVACPKHGGKFNVKSGEAVAFPCVIPVMTYDVEVRGDEVWLLYE